MIKAIKGLGCCERLNGDIALCGDVRVLCEERACELNQGQGDLKGQNLSGGGQTIERSR